MKKIVLKGIRWYQHYIGGESPVLKPFFLSVSTCRFNPTCSEYMYKAIKRFGIIKGLYLGVLRIFRCHPFHKGGFDPVPTKK